MTDTQDMIAVQEDGINAHGFGLIYRAAMQDPDISVTAKGIYAYLCSISGSGGTSYTSRERMLEDMGLSKKAYYAHVSELYDQGYLARKQLHAGGKGRGFGRNIITIVAMPAKHEQAVLERLASQNQTMEPSKHASMKVLGYGIIPRSVMCDREIPLKAKAMYAYFVAFAGTRRQLNLSAYLTKKDLDLSPYSFRKYLGLLNESGYLSARSSSVGENETDLVVSIADRMLPNSAGAAQEPIRLCPSHTDKRKEEDTCVGKKEDTHSDSVSDDDKKRVHTKYPEEKRGHTNPASLEGPEEQMQDFMQELSESSGASAKKEYTQIWQPEKKEDAQSAAGFGKEDTQNAFSVKKEDTEKDDTEKEDTEKEDTIIKSILQTRDFTNISVKSINPSIGKTRESKEPDSDWLDGLTEIKRQICYDVLRQNLEDRGAWERVSALDAIVDALAGVLLHTAKSYRINQADIPGYAVAERFRSVGQMEVSYVLDGLDRTEREIRNPVAYLRTALYNAPVTMDVYYDSKVAADLKTMG